MSLINYLHIYAVGGNGVHMQATGDSWPTGYASCNLDGIDPAVIAECSGKLGRHSPSMRPGSNSRYLPCTIEGDSIVTVNGTQVCSIGKAVRALRGPSPAYSPSMAGTVAAQVARTITEGTREPEPEAPVAQPEAAQSKQAILDQIMDLLKKLVS